MQLNPYLLFNGQCEAAFKFYEKCLGGKIVAKVTHGESPMAKDTPGTAQQDPSCSSHGGGQRLDGIRRTTRAL